MPVNILLCEGREDGADQRILRKLVGDMQVRPTAGKDAVRGFVLHLRTFMKNPRICAVIDADFPRKPREWSPPQGIPEWSWHDRRENELHRLGWTWPRKEIENYWIDPEVLARTFHWTDAQRDEYARRLDGVLDSLGPPTAARIALTACAPRRDRLSTQVSLVSDPARLEEELRNLAAEYNEDGKLEEQRLLDEFRETLPLCSPGGLLRKHALAVFAGKDILARIQCTAGFPREIKDRNNLVAAITKTVQHEPEPHRWLPEWTSLRDAVEAWEP